MLWAALEPGMAAGRRAAGFGEHLLSKHAADALDVEPVVVTQGEKHKKTACIIWKVYPVVKTGRPGIFLNGSTGIIWPRPARSCALTRDHARSCAILTSLFPHGIPRTAETGFVVRRRLRDRTRKEFRTIGESRLARQLRSRDRRRQILRSKKVVDCSTHFRVR